MMRIPARGRMRFLPSQIADGTANLLLRLLRLDADLLRFLREVSEFLLKLRRNLIQRSLVGRDTKVAQLGLHRRRAEDFSQRRFEFVDRTSRRFRSGEQAKPRLGVDSG